MPPQVALILCLLFILFLFKMDSKHELKVSRALWIPVVWMAIAGSRSVSGWLQVGRPSSDGNLFDQSIIAALMAFGISVLVRRGAKIRTLLRSNRPIVLFFLYSAGSILWSEYPAATFSRWPKAFGDLLMVLIILTDPAPIDAVERTLSRVSFLLLPLSILFIKYYPERGRYYDLWEGIQRYSGVAVDKNMLGMTCLAFPLVSAWRVIEIVWNREHNHKTRSLIAHSIVLCMGLQLFSEINSMTSLWCFIIAISLIVATRLPTITRTPWVIHLLLAGVLLFTSSVAFFGIGGSIYSSIGRDPTLTGRTELWLVLYEMNPNPILGVGFEAFWRGPRLEQLAQTIGAANEAHNGYLEVFLNLGWTGVALLAIIIVVGYRNAFRSFGRNPATGRLWLGYFLAVLLYSFTEAGFRMFSPLWMTFLLAIIGPSATFTNTQATKKLTRKGNGLAEYFTHNMEHKEFGSRQPLTRIPRLSESAEDVLSK